MSIDFTINLGGNFVEAMGKSTKATDEAGKHAHEAAKEFEAFEGELGKVRAGAATLNFNAFQEGGHFLQFDLAEGAAIAAEAVHKVVEEVVDLGEEMIKAAGATEDLNLAIKLDVGDEGLDKVGELAEKFAGTRFTPKSIKEALLPILEESGDEESAQWGDLATAATDVATRRNTGKGGAKSALDALRAIEIQPQRIRGSLKELGIRQTDFYSDLGDLLGISSQAAEKQVKAGKVKAQTLLSIALHQIAEREGGALGNATNEGNQTLGASLARLGDVKDTIFERLAGSKGMEAVKGFLNNFIDTLEGPIGTDLVAKVGGAFETLFGDLSGPEGLKKVQDGIGAAAKVVEGLVQGFQDAWPSIKAAITAIPGILNEVVRLTEEFAVIWTGQALVNGLGAFITLLQSQGLAGGLTALRTGLNSALSPVAALTIAFEAWRYAFEKISETIKELGGLKQVGQDLKDWMGGNNASGVAYDNHITDSSPQWKKDRVAQQQAAGKLEIPLMADGGIVTGPTLAIIGEAGPEMVLPLSNLRSPGDAGLGGGGPTITIGDIVLQGSGGGDPQELARSVRVEVVRIVDELMATYGAAA